MIPTGYFSGYLSDAPPTHTPELIASIFPLARRDFRHVPGASARMGIAVYVGYHLATGR